MEKKKKLIILGVILLLIIVSGATFAILTWNSTMIKLGINTNCFTIDYTKGGDITGSLKLINEEDLISNGKFTIKEGVGVSAVNIGINSNCSIEGYGKILLNITSISNVFTTGDSKGALKYAVLKNTSTITNPTNINTTSLLNQSFDIVAIGSITSNDKINLLTTQLSNTEVNKYIVVIYIDNNLAGNDITSATFSGNISSEAEQLVPTPDYCFSISKDETNKTASITDYLCYEGNSEGYETITNVIIPKNIDGYKITSINKATCSYGSCSGAFYNRHLTSVIIPDSVTTIGDRAFSSNQLTNISLPNSVTTIEYGAFSSNQLISVTIPNSLTTIGNSVFELNKLTSIVIPNSVTTIGYGAFGRNQLTSVVIPNSVTTIGGGAFYGNQLISVTIPDSVTSLSGFGSNQLTSIVIPNSITTIGDGAFSDNQLTSIVIPDSVTTIEYNAFSHNQLISIILPDSVTTIGSDAFSYNNLNYVYIGNNSKLTSIGHTVFSSSNRTQTIDITGRTYIDNPNLKKIYYNGSNSLLWIYAINGSDTTTKFVTGTVPSSTSGSDIYNEVLIMTGK